MNVNFENLSAYQCRPRYQPDLSSTSGWMSSGANGTRDSEGTSRWLFSRELISATSTVYLPALRSASTRLRVVVALPVATSTLMPNFFVNAAMIGRYWRDGAPPEATDSVPSSFAASISFDHSCSKFPEAAPRPALVLTSKNSDASNNLPGLKYAQTFFSRSFIKSLPLGGATSSTTMRCDRRAVLSARPVPPHRSVCGARHKSSLRLAPRPPPDTRCARRRTAWFLLLHRSCLKGSQRQAQRESPRLPGAPR